MLFNLSDNHYMQGYSYWLCFEMMTCEETITIIQVQNSEIHNIVHCKCAFGVICSRQDNS